MIKVKFKCVSSATREEQVPEGDGKKTVVVKDIRLVPIDSADTNKTLWPGNVSGSIVINGALSNLLEGIDGGKEVEVSIGIAASA